MFTNERGSSQLRRQGIRASDAQTFQSRQTLATGDQLEIIIRWEAIVIEIQDDKSTLFHQKDH